MDRMVCSWRQKFSQALWTASGSPGPPHQRPKRHQMMKTGHRSNVTTGHGGRDTGRDTRRGKNAPRKTRSSAAHEASEAMTRATCESHSEWTVAKRSEARLWRQRLSTDWKGEREKRFENRRAAKCHVDMSSKRAYAVKLLHRCRDTSSLENSMHCRDEPLNHGCLKTFGYAGRNWEGVNSCRTTRRKAVHL